MRTKPGKVVVTLLVAIAGAIGAPAAAQA